jgi:hypothetical protein
MIKQSLLIPLLHMTLPGGFSMASSSGQCKRENKAELSHSPRYGIEDEERGSQGQSEVEVWGEGGIFG